MLNHARCDAAIDHLAIDLLAAIAPGDVCVTAIWMIEALLLLLGYIDRTAFAIDPQP